MVYVALLRGINVGGNNLVSMARLKATFESLGFGSVKTYINSGNVVFKGRIAKPKTLASRLEKAIATDFGMALKVVVRSIDAMEALVESIPKDWSADENSRCEVMFLWDEFDSPNIIDELPTNPGIDDYCYRPGAIIWHISRSNASKTRMTKLVGTPLYRGMTARNTNTVRKLLALMRECGGAASTPGQGRSNSAQANAYGATDRSTGLPRERSDVFGG